MSRQSNKKYLGMSNGSKTSNKLVLKDPLSCNQMSIFTPGNIKKKKKKPDMTCNNISIWYKPCSWCWAKWITRMECARILSHLVPVCTDLSNLFDSALLLRWDMWSCQTVSDGKSLDTSMQVDLWGPEGFDRLGYMPAPFLWVCVCVGGGTMLIKKNTFPNVNRFILSILSPLDVSRDFCLRGLIFNAVSLPSVDSHSRPGWCCLSGSFDWSLTYGLCSRH